jgi:hypothetical protein
MINPHLFTLESDNGQSASVYELGDLKILDFWAKIGASVFRVGSMDDLDDFIDLLQEIKNQAEEEMSNMNKKDHAFIEDAFIADEEGWIDLPGGAGRVSPEGTVYDKDGVEMYSLYLDEPATDRYKVTYYSDDHGKLSLIDPDDYEWM